VSIEANIDALVRSKPAPKATATRARTMLRALKADTPEKILEIGRIEFLRMPNCGLKTTKFILEIAGYKKPPPPAPVPKPKPVILTMEQKLRRARLEIGGLYRQLHTLRERLRDNDRHIADLQDYNKRMSQTVKDVIAAYYVNVGKPPRMHQIDGDAEGADQ
jgi:hypothetical protein